MFKEHVALSLPWEDRAVSSAPVVGTTPGPSGTHQVRDVPKDTPGGQCLAWCWREASEGIGGRDGTLRVVGAREPSIAANILEQEHKRMRVDVNCCSERVNASQ